MVKKNYAFGLTGDDIHQIIQWKYPVFHQKSECYISFVCFDPAQGKMRAKKIMLDHIKGKRKQRDYAEQLITRIVQKLMNGWNPWIEVSQPLEYTLFDDVLERYKRYLEKLCNDHNLRKESFIDYSSRVRILERDGRRRRISSSLLLISSIDISFLSSWTIYSSIVIIPLQLVIIILAG